LNDGFQSEAEMQNITVTSVAVSYSLRSLSDDMKKLKDTQYRHICVVAFDHHIEPIFVQAQQLDMLGKDYMYVLHGIDPVSWNQKTYPAGRASHEKIEAH
jgi:hypothetical protein